MRVPYREVLSEAHADLVLLATHGRGEIHRLLVGRVADRVIRMAPCPVCSRSRKLDPGAGIPSGACMPAPVGHDLPNSRARVRPRGLENPRLPARSAVALSLLSFPEALQRPEGGVDDRTETTVGLKEGGKGSCVR